jgi:hypothetical protein
VSRAIAYLTARGLAMANDLVPATLHERIRAPLKKEPEPPTWAYDRRLIAEARRRGIGPLPRANALNDQWRKHLEQQIGKTLIMEILFRRKPGQRGPGKQPEIRQTDTGREILDRKKAAYWLKKAPPYVVR